MSMAMAALQHVRAPRGQRRTCTVNGCTKVAVGWGYCTQHYQRWQRYGDAEAPRFEYWPQQLRERLGELLDRGWSDVRIGRELGKSASSVHKARLRFGMNPCYRRGHTAREVSRLLGVHSMAPSRWIADGRLTVSKRAAYGPKQCLMIDHFELCGFLSDPTNWHCYDPSALTDSALRAWLTRLRGDVRFISVKEAAARLGVCYTSVRRLADLAGVTLPKDGGIVWVCERDLPSISAQRKAAA